MLKNKLNTVYTISAMYLFCMLIYYIIGYISNYIVIHFIMKYRLVHWTMYEGFAPYTIIFIMLFLMVFCFFSKKNYNVFGTSILFYLLVILVYFPINLYQHYVRFYVETTSNGAFTKEQLWEQICNQAEDFVGLFSYNFGSFLASDFWVIISFILVAFAAKKLKKTEFSKMNIIKRMN